MQTISATDLVRNTRKILDKVVGRRETIVVKRNHILIARITPPEQTMTAAQALAGLHPMLTPKQRTAWLQDSQQGFDQLVCDPRVSSSIAASG
jgi:antitoxin (DNA-binding transcriptional repressor) of toxin-antitoxin stability system